MTARRKRAYSARTLAHRVELWTARTVKAEAEIKRLRQALVNVMREAKPSPMTAAGQLRVLRAANLGLFSDYKLVAQTPYYRARRGK